MLDGGFMSNLNYWEALRQDRFEEALDIVSKQIVADCSVPNLNNRATIYLLLGDYEKALDDYMFVLNNTKEESRGDDQFIDIGVTLWLLDRKNDAVEYWKKGLDPKLKYTTNYINVPAILHFAGIQLQDEVLKRQAKKVLQKRGKNSIDIARFLLGDMNEEEFLANIKMDDPLLERKMCKAHFYTAIKCLESGNKDGYFNRLKKCRDIKGKYLEHEYFLAVGELEKKINVS
jgi:tetratricopeptide (TPR) repeat protein